MEEKIDARTYKRLSLHVPANKLPIIERLRKLGDKQERSLSFMLLLAAEKYLADEDV